jgi:hypothetical protein
MGSDRKSWNEKKRQIKLTWGRERALKRDEIEDTRKKEERGRQGSIFRSEGNIYSPLLKMIYFPL